MTRLTELATGSSGMIGRVEPTDEGSLLKLMSLGILPGTRVLLLQRFPSYIFRAGQTEISLDRQLAAQVLVESRGTEGQP